MRYMRLPEENNGESNEFVDLNQVSSESVDAILQVRNARTSYDIFKILKSYIPVFRLDHFAVFVTQAEKRTALDDRAVLTNWDSEVIHRGLEDEFFDWSVTSELRESVLPKSVLVEDALKGDNGTNNRELAEFLLSKGYNALVHLPVRSSNGKTGYVGLGGMRDVVGDEELMQLSYVAEHAFERLMQIVEDGDLRENPLSDREIECLKAAARGLSVSETSHRIGITSHTVNYHLANAQKKLTARNKLHAVVNAIQRGWLGEF